jgi:DNA-binding NarL/FixJ family response regulator
MTAVPPAVGVLTVDDHAVFRAVAREVVEATPGFEALAEVASGAEALALCETVAPDLVLMDMRMPEMDGIETARRLREIRPGAVVVLISSEEPAHVHAVADGCGGLTFVRKQDLCSRMLRQLWSGRRGELKLT